MKIITTGSELRALIGADGKVSEPITMAEGCEFFGLESLTSFEGITMAKGCKFFGLTSLTSFDVITMAKGCKFLGLNSSIKLSATPSEEEMKIIKQIPIEKINMSSWHCGTAHCLAGWAQVISGRPMRDSTAISDGRELLPSLSHLFFAPDEPVKKLLMKLQAI